jgi:Domain of unknown function (DUF1814).
VRKGAASLKDRIKNLAKEKRVSSRILLQNYMFERFLERVASSPYKDKFVVKGGVLIAAMVGITSRSTMDLDLMLRAYPLDEEHIKEAVGAICSIDMNDGIRIDMEGIRAIRNEDDYGGFRVTLRAHYDTIRVPMTLDVTSGDAVTPSPVRYAISSMFSENTKIQVWAYNTETILAEKIETVLRRGLFNSRSRDFYDIYVLSRTQDFDIRVLHEAIRRTARHRNTINQIKDTRSILLSIQQSEELAAYWRNYQREYEYASDISFLDVIAALHEATDSLEFEEIEWQ